MHRLTQFYARLLTFRKRFGLEGIRKESAAFADRLVKQSLRERGRHQRADGLCGRRRLPGDTVTGSPRSAGRPVRRGVPAPRDEGQVTLLVLGFVVLAVALITVVVAATGVHLDRKRLLDVSDLASLAAADLSFCHAGGLDWDVRGALAPLGDRAQVAASIDALLAQLLPALRPGDHVLCMSNGSFGGIHGRLDGGIIAAAVFGNYKMGFITLRASLKNGNKKQAKGEYSYRIMFFHVYGVVKFGTIYLIFTKSIAFIFVL